MLGEIISKSTDAQIISVPSQSNKSELKRLEDLKTKNQKLLDEATKIEKQWNKLDKNIEDVVADFNKEKSIQEVKDYTQVY